jgi:hypothetical protein
MTSLLNVFQPAQPGVLDMFSTTLRQTVKDIELDPDHVSDVNQNTTSLVSTVTVDYANSLPGLLAHKTSVPDAYDVKVDSYVILNGIEHTEFNADSNLQTAFALTLASFISGVEARQVSNIVAYEYSSRRNSLISSNVTFTITWSSRPSDSPSAEPSSDPSTMPSSVPSDSPTRTPTNVPTKAPTTQTPTYQPTTKNPTTAPTALPTASPTVSPTVLQTHTAKKTDLGDNDLKEPLSVTTQQTTEIHEQSSHMELIIVGIVMIVFVVILVVAWVLIRIYCK